jgi:hypothetical protein
LLINKKLKINQGIRLGEEIGRTKNLTSSWVSGSIDWLPIGIPQKIIAFTSEETKFVASRS